MTKLKILLVEDKFGQYQNKDGKRYSLIYGTYVVGPRAKDFVEFETLEQALEFYNLEEVKDEDKRL